MPGPRINPSAENEALAWPVADLPQRFSGWEFGWMDQTMEKKKQNRKDHGETKEKSWKPCGNVRNAEALCKCCYKRLKC